MGIPFVDHPADWRSLDPRPVGPFVVRLAPEGRYFIAGTEYGVWRTSSGDLRTWGSASGARKALKRYAAIHQEHEESTR